ncbi:MAG TPA: winged helix DNA-binding domain-containing protein [Candidatus Limnocylindria bacterium]|nr:winged helix DNA-binding domain-containing protein [Candidatus Limnocylindria bacterium]
MLTARQLNRALLARQLLLERSRGTIEEVLESIGGLQTQYAPAGYIGLWSRMDGFERAHLTEALESRRVIQGTLMRATIHMVSAADYWPMEVGVRDARRAWWLRAAASQYRTLDPDAVARAVGEELAAGPMKQKALSARLRERGLDAPQAGINMLVDVVRVPPSGTWDQRRADLYGLAADWLRPPRRLTERDGIELLIRRYLGGFGPAALADAANWMGANLSAVKEVAASLDLREFRDQDGRTLVDLPDGPLPDADAPVPPRFLPVWDATLLVHARRTQILPEQHRPRVFNTRTPHSFNTFLLDGQVAGTWRETSGEIVLEPFGRLTDGDRRALETEAAGLARLHAA